MAKLDPQRESVMKYASKAIAAHAAKFGDLAAAHRRSQEKLGMSDAEYGLYCYGYTTQPPLSEEQAAQYARDLKEGK